MVQSCQTPQPTSFRLLMGILPWGLLIVLFGGASVCAQERLIIKPADLVPIPFV